MGKLQRGSAASCTPFRKRRRLRQHTGKGRLVPARVSCYSPGGFLVDTLEGSGFIVRSLESYGPGRREFRLDVQLAIDDETLSGLLQSSIESAVNQPHGQGRSR